jgi:hypothetical protein
METKTTPSGCKRMSFLRFIPLLFTLVFMGAGRAQTTNILSLCTGEAFRAAIGIGGIYQIDCGTNLPTIALSEPLVIEKNLTLTSTGQVIITGQNLTRLFVVKPGVRLTLQNILLFSGRQTETNLNDGGIPDTAGAGIYNDGGIVNLLNARFDSHSVIGVTGAAGDSDERAGEPGGDGAGAAIYNNGGQIYISNTVFVANSVTGGIGGAGAVGAGGSGGNGGNGGNGGSASGAAIYSNGGMVTVYASVFTNNTATGAAAGAGGASGGFLGFTGNPGDAGVGLGAAIGGANAQIIIAGCTFVTNVATGAAGLAGNTGGQEHEGGTGPDGGDAAGGAVYSTGQLSVTNCTFFGNSAVGGAGGAGGASGSSLFGKNGGVGGDGGTATGGAIENDGNGVIINCTFSDNVVTGGAGGAGGAASGIGKTGNAGNTGTATGGAIYGESGISVANSILANSSVTIAGNVTDLGGNLSTDANPLLTANSSMKLTNPFFTALADNGGPTPTMALLTNSPAIDHGVAAYCPPFDQRGTNRLGSCDIGAFELLNGSSISLPPIPTNVLSSFSFTNSANNMVLLWPSGYTNLFLQISTNLQSTNTVWTTLTNVATTTGGTNFVSLSTANGSRPTAFFRLIGLTNLSLTNISGIDTNTTPFPPFPPLPGT